MHKTFAAASLGVALAASGFFTGPAAASSLGIHDVSTVTEFRIVCHQQAGELSLTPSRAFCVLPSGRVLTLRVHDVDYDYAPAPDAGISINLFGHEHCPVKVQELAGSNSRDCGLKSKPIEKKPIQMKLH